MPRVTARQAKASMLSSPSSIQRSGMKLRAATAGYILRKWSVDCSPDHSLRGHEFRLWLKDPLALYGVKNALLAPGYRSPDQNKGEQ